MTVIWISLHNINPVSLCYYLPVGLSYQVTHMWSTQQEWKLQIYTLKLSQVPYRLAENILWVDSAICSEYSSLQKSCLIFLQSKNLKKRAVKAGQKCLQRQQEIKNLVDLWEGENKADFMTRLV